MSYTCDNFTLAYVYAVQCLHDTCFVYHVQFALASLKCMFLTVSNCEGCITGSQGGNKD